MIMIFIAIIKKKSFSPELESLQAVAAQVDCVARCDLPDGDHHNYGEAHIDGDNKI